MAASDEAQAAALSLRPGSRWLLRLYSLDAHFFWAFLRSVNWREAGAVMEVAEQGWGFVCVGADFDCDLCCEHEHHLGEGYVDAQSTDFRKSFDSEGRIF